MSSAGGTGQVRAAYLVTELIEIPEVSRRLLRMPTEVRCPLGGGHPPHR